jgi:ATP-dependent Lon protease
MPRRKVDVPADPLPSDAPPADPAEVKPVAEKRPRRRKAPVAAPPEPMADEPEAAAAIAPPRRKARSARPRHSMPAAPFGTESPFELDFGVEDLDFEQGPLPPLRASRIELPVIPLRDMVIFPRMVTQFFVGRDISMRAVEEAMVTDRRIIAVAQREAELEDVTPSDLFTTGVELIIGRQLKMPDGTTALVVQGQHRVRIKKYVQKDPYLRAIAEVLPEVSDKSLPTEAMMRAVLALFEKVVKMSRNANEDALVAAMNVDDPGWLADLIASSVPFELAQRQSILETTDVSERLQKLSIMLAKEVDVLDLETRIQNQVQKEVDKSQREYYLREQMKAIQHELGEDDPQTRETNELRTKIEAAHMPEEVHKKAIEELDRLALMPAMAPEVGVIRTYLDWLIALPWEHSTADHLNIKEAERTLEENHYGLPKVKERILEYMAVRRLAQGKMRSPILCFVGPPGVGKTSLGRSIAQALGRKFVRVSLGGIRDEAEIRGHRRTYVGALPGRIVRALREAGSMNPVVLLDEIDKVSAGYAGDPAAALLEVLDPAQNHTFRDHYLEVDLDLSDVLFLATANVIDTIPGPLLDRMELVTLDGYTEAEKVAIARDHLVPRQLERAGLTAEDVGITDEALGRIAGEHTREAGVRQLERALARIMRKVAVKLASGASEVRVDVGNLADYLGRPRFTPESAERTAVPGVATGLAVTGAGGDVLFIEATSMEGEPGLTLTGQLGDVMKESAHIALSYLRSHGRELGIDPNTLAGRRIHLHVPAGAVPKDGPSAGITMVTALASLVTGRPVRPEFGMTGEVTLAGRVLPIGGVKQKLLAAHRAGLTEVIVPARNEPDLDDVPEEVRAELKIHVLADVKDVLELALRPAAAPASPADLVAA